MSFFHIIRALLLLLSATLLLGCSVARLGYGQLPSLSYWWVDSYFDLDDAQSVALHDTTPAQVCQMVDRLKPRLDALLAASEPALTRALRSPDAVYREQIAQLVQGNCRTFAQLHNNATPSQQQKLAVKLKGFEDDARVLTVP